MTILQAIVLGFVQGITEFLPISSSGHLLIVPSIFNWPEHALDFDVAVHVATLFAVVWVFWSDLERMARMATRKSKERSLVIKLVIATIPVGIVGVLLSTMDIEAFRNTKIVLSGLIGWGAVLWIADIFSNKWRRQVRRPEDVSWWKAILIGCVQALSLLPGTSRSGITMTFGLFSGLDRTTAARFSFLLAIPALAGAGFVTALDAAQNGLETPVLPLIVGFICALISGVVAIKFLLRLVGRTSYAWFGAYRILLGAILWLLIV